MGSKRSVMRAVITAPVLCVALLLAGTGTCQLTQCSITTARECPDCGVGKTKYCDDFGFCNCGDSDLINEQGLYPYAAIKAAGPISSDYVYCTEYAIYEGSNVYGKELNYHLVDLSNQEVTPEECAYACYDWHWNDSISANCFSGVYNSLTKRCYMKADRAAFRVDVSDTKPELFVVNCIAFDEQLY